MFCCFVLFYSILLFIEFTDNPESAFVYALTSALMVQQIAIACSLHQLRNECGCGQPPFQQPPPHGGWSWGCSHDFDYGTRFAQDYLDHRDIDSVASSDQEAAAVHLYNNAVGRRVRCYYVQ